jgi:hypothetical protein
VTDHDDLALLATLAHIAPRDCSTTYEALAAEMSDTDLLAASVDRLRAEGLVGTSSASEEFGLRVTRAGWDLLEPRNGQ